MNFTMKLLTILATIFCGGTLLVGADYYIEFRAPSTAGASSSSARTQPTMASFMYQCEFPQGTTAYTTDRSRCTPIPTSAMKVIHATHTFYSVYGANLGGHVIHLSDRGIMPNNLVWMLGYSNYAIDHPNFGEPSQETVAFLGTKVAEMRLNNAVPASMLPGLAQYFAQTNLVSLCRSPDVAKLQLSTFTSFMKKIVERNRNAHLERNPARAAALRAQITLAIQVSLQKMIDPCSLLPGNTYRPFATRSCQAYCNFLGVVAQYYGDAASRSHPLRGGHCVGAVCNCFKVVAAVLGCQYSRMHESNNALRMNLLDHWTGPGVYD